MGDTQPPQKHHPSPPQHHGLWQGWVPAILLTSPCAEHPALVQDTDPSHHHIQRHSQVGGAERPTPTPLSCLQGQP